VNLSRAKLEQLTADLNKRMYEPCQKALKDAGVSAKDINEVVLVGGMTRMPSVVAVAREIFGKEPSKGVNPDEVVAVGAAIQGAVLTGEAKDIVLLDVTPLTLGVETLGGVFTPLIERNTTIPTRKTERFSTAADNQPEVTIHVLQGERKMASGNRSLGSFNLTGIPPAPRGLPQIEVTFDLDANGILNVSAKDMATAKEQSIVIRGSSGLNESDIKRMVKDAEEHKDEDERRRELIDARNSADKLVFDTEKLVKEHGDKVGPSERSAIEAGIKHVKEVQSSDDTATIKRACEELTTATHKLAEAMYRAVPPSQAAGAAGPGPSREAEGGGPGAGPRAADPAGGDGKVVDADFTVVDDEKGKGKKK
jgi:molecular chaperone DnaK